MGRTLTAGLFLAALTACAGAPAPVVAPVPVVGVEGAWAFSGYFHGAGVVDGIIRFDSAGTATLSTGTATCASEPMASDGRFRLRCGGVAISVARADDALAPQAMLSVRVTEWVDKPADPFECRGEEDQSAFRRTGCTAYGVKRTSRTSTQTVGTVLSRVE